MRLRIFLGDIKCPFALSLSKYPSRPGARLRQAQPEWELSARGEKELPVSEKPLRSQLVHTTRSG